MILYFYLLTLLNVEEPKFLYEPIYLLVPMIIILEPDIEETCCDEFFMEQKFTYEEIK